MNERNYFPDIITKLPSADIPLDGITSYILQGENHQLVFMDFCKDAEVPEHSHEAQWEVVLDGEINLTMEGNKHTYKKGDTFYIPKDIKHSASVKNNYKSIALFNQKDRYKTK